MAANLIPFDLNAISVIDDLDLDGLYQSLRGSELVEQRTFQVLREILLSDMPIVIDDERANNDDIYKSVSSHAEVLRSAPQLTYSALQTMFASTQSAIRDKINILSRPYVRPLRILDMPDEILVKIFEHVSDLEERWTFGDSDISPKEIKNVRLTCRKFCNTSSHLLLHFLHVEISSASLSHLEEISRHSTISKGVRTLRVVIDFYDSLLAGDFRTFAVFSRDNLSTTIEFMELMNVAIDGLDEVTVDRESEERDLEVVRKLKVILQSWNRVLVETSDGNISEEEVGFQNLLRRAHREYGQRFAQQQAALENGTFVRAVAAAVSRMPRVNRLEVQDFDDSAKRKRSASALEQANNPSALFQHLVLGHRWEKTISRGLGQVPTALMDLLVKLPIAIHKEGSSILDFWVEVSPTENFSALEPTSEQRYDISAAVKQLKCFTFRPVGRYTRQGPIREPHEIKAIEKYITAFTDTPTLEIFSVWMNELWRRPPTVSLGSIINTRPWPNLRFVHWSGFSLCLTELERGLERLSNTVLSLIIRSIHLLSGTWVDALDIFRRKFLGSLQRSLNFESPSGAECEWMSLETYEAVFQRDFNNSAEGSQAEKYIRGSIDQNPLRDHEL